MIDVIIESVPWDKVGEGLLAAGAAVAAWWAGDKISQAMTGKSLWQNIVSLFPREKERICEWFRRQRRTSNIYKGAVFVIKSIAAGGRKVVAYALKNDNTRVKTGIEVVYTKSKVPRNMPTDKEFQLALSELGV